MADENAAAEEGLDPEFGEGGGDGDPAGESGEENEEKDEGGEKEENLDPEKHEVKKRMTPRDFILERQEKRKERLAALEKEKNEREEMGEDILTREEKDAIKNQLDPVINFFQEQADDMAVKNHLSENPNHKKYEGIARKYLKDPAYKNVPVEMIFNHLSYSAAKKAGAKEALAAERAAKENRLSGNSFRKPDGGKKSFSDLSDKDFEEMNRQIISGELDPKKVSLE